MIFANKQYPVNIKNGKSFIYPTDSLSLGDNILMTMISQVIFRDNPDEEISLLPFSYDIVQEVKRERPKKLFLRIDSTCVTDKDIEKLEKLTQVFKFELHQECHALWKRGEYPIFSPKSAETIHELSVRHYDYRDWNIKSEYVVFHIRNINKIRSKNTDPEWVEKILDHLIYNWTTKQEKPCFVVLVGNDDSYGRKIEHLAYDTVVDFRNKLTLDEIYHVISSSKLFIGSDSGIAHLAGCCNVPMVCWGFESELWFPKVRNIKDCLFLTKAESKIEVVLKEIEKKIR